MRSASQSKPCSSPAAAGGWPVAGNGQTVCSALRRGETRRASATEAGCRRDANWHAAMTCRLHAKSAVRYSRYEAMDLASSSSTCKYLQDLTFRLNLKYLRAHHSWL